MQLCVGLQDDFLIIFRIGNFDRLDFFATFVLSFFFGGLKMYGQLHKLSNHNVGGAVDNTNQATKRLNATA